jgi:phosphoadenosine phosphosulfate reductase
MPKVPSLVDRGRRTGRGVLDGSENEGDDIVATSAEIEIEPQEVEARAYEFESAPAGRVIEWAVERFGSGVSLACSFQDCVIIDVAVRVDPGIEVLFLDTGFHFPETLAFVEDVRRRYDLNLRVLTPGPEADAFPCGSDRCCELRKVAPLDRALLGRQAWMTGLKRVDALTRAATPIVSWDETRRLVKVNPIATWTEDDVTHYQRDHDLPIHPLVPRGYLSIGCAPTTRPVAPGEDPRAGRWAGSNKTECGLHV